MKHSQKKKLYWLYLLLAGVLALGMTSNSNAEGVKVIIENRAPVNGTWLTPFWVGFHNGSFDYFDLSSAASGDLENMAEDGNFDPLMTSFDNSGLGNAQGLIVSGAVPPFEPNESAEMTFIIDGNDPNNRFFSFGAMVLPSNDAFVGNDNPSAHQIFDNSGNFLGGVFTIYGTDVMDAGTEVNDELPMNTAFFGQMAPNTGVDENGVVHTHPGYLPPGSGGVLDSSLFVNADFTQMGYEVARITIVRSDTPVSGNVSGVWDIGGSPYLLDGEVTVPAGQTLTIDPGVVVFSNSWYGLHVQGTLRAIGTDTDSILFTTTPVGFPPSNPGWKGIRFENAGNNNEIAYSIIENAKVTAGGAEDQGAGIHSINSSPIIRNSTLRVGWAGDAGGAIYLEGGNPVITDNLITDNTVKWETSCYGGGIAAYGSNLLITGNIITNNTLYSTGTYPSFVDVARGGGLYLNNCSGLVAYNLITNNLANSAGGSISSESAGGGMQIWGGTIEVRNNTFSENSKVGSLNGGGGAIAIYGLYGNAVTIANNIFDRNTGGGIYFDDFTANATVEYNDFYLNGDDFQGQIPAGLGVISTTNYNGDPADNYLNIFLDPLFVDAGNDDYTLQAGSPAIDAGSPTTPYDPDGTLSDQGAFYYDQGGMPDLTIDLTYLSGSPVPAGGGNLTFGIYVINNGSIPLNFDGWLAISYDGGAATTVVLRHLVNYQPGWTIDRPNTYYPVPSGYAAGDYTFYGRVGSHPNVIWDEDSFPFSKEGTNFVAGFIPYAVNGAPDPFDRIDKGAATVEAPSTYSLESAYPNPFNPTTTIRYAIPEAAKVTLTVYDIQGRQVAKLVNGFRQAGSHEVTFDASQLASGVYLYRLSAPSFTAIGKMTLLK